MTQNISKLPLLASLGNPSEDNNCNYERGSPTELFKYSISFTNWSDERKYCKGFPHVAFYPPSRSLQNQSQFHQLKYATKILQGVNPRSLFSPIRVIPESESEFNCAAKNKGLLAEGQQLNSKYDTYQDQVLILRRTGYRTQ